MLKGAVAKWKETVIILSGACVITHEEGGCDTVRELDLLGASGKGCLNLGSQIERD